MPQLLDYSITGLSESLFTFLLLLLAYFTLCRPKPVFCGILIGLTFLTKTPGVLLLIPLVFISKKSFPLVLLGFTLLIMFQHFFLPPLAQSKAPFAQHQLWRVIGINALIPSSQITRSAQNIITPSRLLTHIDLIIFKVMRHLYASAKDLFTFISPPILVLFLLSPPHSLKKFLILGFLPFLLFHLVTVFSFRYLQPFAPLLIILAARLITRKSFLPMTLVIVASFFTYPGFGTSAWRSLTYRHRPTQFQLLASLVRENTTANQVIATDAFAQISWYSGRRSLQLPLALSELDHADALLLYSHPHKPAYEPQWQSLLDSPRNFASFQFIKTTTFPPDQNYYSFPVTAVLYSKKPAP